MRVFMLILAVLLLAAACSDEPVPTPVPTAIPTRTQTPTPTPTLTPTPTQTPEVPTPTPTFSPGAVILPTVEIPVRTPTPVPSAEQVLARKLDIIGFRTSILRGLPASGPVARAFVTKDELRALVAEEMEEDREETLLTQKLYTTLGILEPDVDLFNLMAGVFTDIVLGFFDTEENKLYVVGDETDFSEQNELTVAHEFVHGLQQLHFDLDAIRESIEDNTDHRRAFRALVEGDATVGELLYGSKHFDDRQRAAVQAEARRADFSAYFAAPLVIQRTIAFPYLEGRSFAVELFLQTEDFELIDEAFEYVPRSSEQIIHPEKYANREEPVEVTVPDVSSSLGEGWAELDRDTFGELLLRSYLASWIDPQVASAAAAGWGGDRFALYEGPGHGLALGAVTRWDTEEDAMEFIDAFRDVTQARLGSDWDPLEDVESAFILRGASQTALISLKGLDVTIVLAPDAPVLPSVLEELRSAGAPG